MRSFRLVCDWHSRSLYVWNVLGHHSFIIRYENVLRPTPKEEWTAADNVLLMDSVEKFGVENWDLIAVGSNGSSS